ncbi:MAG: LL-diaminopimelate aminotransferase [Candidatus Eisenbacteria sp.]|nr:LL-diaminopimelate aminotransferase [Candidatus Eisenbacteria bacterium]
MPPGRGRKKIEFERADRLKKLPPYLFVEIDRKKRLAQKRGMDLVDLGIGDPDLPTPARIVEKLRREALRLENHRYPSARKLEEFSAAAARWFGRRYGVKVNPATQVLPVIGTKEGLGHFPLAFVNPGDVVLIPDPAYPVYHSATVLAGGVSKRLPLREEDGFLPDLDRVDKRTRARARILFLNYPNNPTAAVADRAFYRSAVEFALENRIILVNDAAYAEIAYDGFKCPSLLQERGAFEVAVEFHSLSKTYNMCGWRVGFAVGNADLIAGLAKLKSNIDSDVFGAVLGAATTALRTGGPHLKKTLRIYEERRDILVGGLREMGWDVRSPEATFYIWLRVPGGQGSVRFASDLIRSAGVVTAPGVGFGEMGEGYIRMSLTCGTGKIRQAVRRLKKAGSRLKS